MASLSRTHLGSLIRTTREALDISQDELRRKLRLARSISISKWERGEAPVPAHHWLSLMQLLSIPREKFLEAARRDHHRQLPMYMSIWDSFRDSVGEIGSFTWDVVIKTLAPKTTQEIERLRRQYPEMSPVEFTRAAISYFAEQAKVGLDRNARPIRLDGQPPRPTHELTDQRPGRSAHHRRVPGQR